MGGHPLWRGESLGAWDIDLVYALQYPALTPDNCADSSNAVPMSEVRREIERRQMPVHRFTLIVSGRDLQEDVLIDAVFEPPCSDQASLEALTGL